MDKRSARKAVGVIGLLLILFSAFVVATAAFYLIDRFGGRTARNWTLGIWVVLCFLGLLTLLVLISAQPSGDDETAKALAVIASVFFLILGLTGAGLAWLARRIWG